MKKLSNIEVELKKNVLLIKKAFNSLKARSSRPEVFSKKDVINNFAKFIEKHLCQSLFYDKVASLH